VLPPSGWHSCLVRGLPVHPARRYLIKLLVRFISSRK
jgi:hypothetical protein